MNDYSDENLVAGSCRGSKDAYTQLVERYYKQLFLMCLGIVGNVQDAEDLAQESILKGFLEISKLQKSTHFGPWIIRIARNLSINFVHREQRGREIVSQKVTQYSLEPRSGNSLQQAIEKLPMEIRLPLVMYYFECQSAQKVAESLDMSTSSVYSKLRIALRQLHRLLDEQGETNE